MNYYEANAKLTGRNSERRKLANNTYLERRSTNNGTDIALRLHNTDILVYHANGDITLYTGGWRTVTTKARMNEFLSGWSIGQSKGQWFLYGSYTGNDPLCLYEDGMVLHSDGTFEGGSDLEDTQKNQKIRKQASAYSKAYIKALREGKVPAPSAGDCWGCLMVDVKTGKPACRGEDHILRHFKEKYFVPSLLLLAIDQFPVSPVAKWTMASHWGTTEQPSEGFAQTMGSFGDIGYEQLQKAIYRYCLRQLNQAS